MERPRILAVLVAGGEERVLETVLYEPPVRQGLGQAVEIPRHDDWEPVFPEFLYLAEDQLAPLRAGEAAQVVEVGVQVQEGEVVTMASKFFLVCGAV